jgi:hypothetical protein
MNRMTRLVLGTILFAGGILAAEVRVQRVPESGLQPDAVTDSQGRVHLIYLAGDPKASEIHYVRRSSPSAPWSEPVRVNSQSGSAVAIGTVRGPRLVLAGPDSVAVVWNGSSRAEPKSESSAPLLWTIRHGTNAFQPQQNLFGSLAHLDGGAAIASDGRGRIWVVTHAADSKESISEAARGVYLWESNDFGKTMSAARRIDSPTRGVCACCALTVGFREPNELVVLYRAATDGSARGLIELVSTNGGAQFTSRTLDTWTLNECPMTTTRLDADARCGAWSTRGVIQFGPLPAGGPPVAVSAPGARANHPVIVDGPSGDYLVAWTEGTGWQKGGALAWVQVDALGRPRGTVSRQTGVPVWGSLAAVREADGSYTVLY